MRLAIIFILAALGWGIFQDGTNSVVTGPTVFSKLTISGGGFVVSGPDINGSTILVGSDVYGCEKWNSATSSWIELATTLSVGSSGAASGATGAPGCYFVVAAPSNPSVIAMMIGNGSLWRSTDGGATFTNANFSHTVDSNGTTTRMYGPKAAFDPNNQDILYVSTATDGVYLTTNFTTASAGSETFTAVSSVPTVSGVNADGYVMAFDANGGTTSGRSNIVYIGPFGGNLYQATSAPSGSTPPTFSSLGVASAWQRMMVDPQGTIWIVDGANLNKVTGCRSSCTWNTQTTGLPDGPSAVAVDPNNCSSGATCHVVVAGGTNGASCGSGSGTISTTPDGGTTWHGGNTHSRAGGDAPWLAETNEFNMCPAGIAIDSTGVVWFGEGIGVWTATPNYSAGGVNTVWTAKSKGITNLDANGVLSPPAFANRAVTWQWDRNTLTTDTVHEPSVQNTYAIVASIVLGNTMDVATSDGETLAVVASAGGFDGSGLSVDGGTTWTQFPVASAGQITLTATATLPPGSGGVVVAANSFDAHVQQLMVVQDVTHPFTTAVYVTGAVNPSAGTFGASAPDGSGIPSTVTNGDTITVSWPNSPYRRPLVTNAATTGGNVLHFASVPSWVSPGMLPAAPASGTINSGGGSPTQVLSTTSTTVTMTGNVIQTITLGTITGGSGYVNGTYGAVPLTGGSGSGLTATVVVSGGSVISVFPNQVQSSYAAGDTLSASNTNLGGSGSGFSVPIASVSGVPSGETITFSAQSGGSIAVSTPNNMVFIPANRGAPIYTKDGGNTWASVPLPGVEYGGGGCVNSNTTITSYTGNANNITVGQLVYNPQGVWSGTDTATVTGIVSSTSFTVNQTANRTSCGALFLFVNFNTSFLNPIREVCADRVNTGTFYIYDHAIGHIFKSTDQGDTWADQATASGGGNQNMTSSPYNINEGSQQALKCVPGNPGHLFMASGAANFNTTDQFARSIDGGKTWTSVSGITGVNGFGFGAAKPGGGGYPTIFIAGALSGTYGAYRSDDNAVTWNHLGNSNETNPGYTIAIVGDLEGDKSVYGKVYGSFPGASFFCGAITPGC